MSIRIRRLHEVTEEQISALAEVLVDCVEGGASVSFMAPFSHEDASRFWTNVADDVASGARALLVAENEQGGIVGTVQLMLALPPNQPHRAEVAKMLVHRSARGRRIATQLMLALEQIALDLKRHLLVLDTVTGGIAEHLYEQLGWVRVGVVPDFALFPQGGYCGTTFFYKSLAAR
jgi:GNAT superfamily N-acetyltransferase